MKALLSKNGDMENFIFSDSKHKLRFVHFHQESFLTIVSVLQCRAGTATNETVSA